MKYIFHGNLGGQFCPKTVLGSSFTGEEEEVASVGEGVVWPLPRDAHFLVAEILMSPALQDTEGGTHTPFLRELVWLLERPSWSLATSSSALDFFLLL